MQEITLAGSPGTIHLSEVERDDEQAIIGVNSSGKRFVTRADRKAEPLEPLAERHYPWRLYLRNGEVERVVFPAFSTVEAWFLADDGDALTVRTEGGGVRLIEQGDVLSLLSARPEDEQAVRDEQAAIAAYAEAQATGVTADEADADEADTGVEAE